MAANLAAFDVDGFEDVVVELAPVCADTARRKVLYVVGKEHPLRFLHGGRALKSVLSKNETVAARFRTLHGETYARVRDYYATVKGQVEIIDLRELVPVFKKASLT